MVKIRITKGKWEKIVAPQTLLWEECSNQSCTTGILHYPNYMKGPFCPDCKTMLLGGDLVKGQPPRIAYHLGA
jgi:hypothetical protein